MKNNCSHNLQLLDIRWNLFVFVGESLATLTCPDRPLFWKTAQLNFLHDFLSLIPRNVFGFILKFKIFFVKLALFRVSYSELFCDQYSSIETVFTYLWMATAQWYFLHRLLLLISRNFSWFISKFQKNIFQKM